LATKSVETLRKRAHKIPGIGGTASCFYCIIPDKGLFFRADIKSRSNVFTDTIREESGLLLNESNPVTIKAGTDLGERS
jgi:hypothetical protein